MWNIFRKPTLGLLAGSLAIIYSIPAFFYSLTLKGGESLIALLFIYLFLAAVVTIMIDRLLINKFRKILIVNILELILFPSVYLLISAKLKYENRKAIINIVDSKNNYTIIIKDSSGFKVNKFTREDLFNKQINFVDNTGIIYLDDKSLS